MQAIGINGLSINFDLTHNIHALNIIYHQILSSFYNRQEGFTLGKNTMHAERNTGKAAISHNPK